MLVQQLDRRYLVLDGQQRLRTLGLFYHGIYQGKEFSLQNVAHEFKDLTYRTLTPEQRRQLDNTFIQATIVKTDGTRDSLEAVYKVFERLNSGGTQLTPHEIRIALYPGVFVDLLARLNDDGNWREIYGPKSPRVRDQELILRIMALTYDTYYRPLKTFLNDFLGKHRNLGEFPAEEASRLFRESARLLREAAGRNAIRFLGTKVNTALAEALFVGLIRSLRQGKEITPEQVRDAIASLTTNSDFRSTISGSTANEEAVRLRLAMATQTFAEVE